MGADAIKNTAEILKMVNLTQFAAGDEAMNFLRWTGVGHRPIIIEDINTVYESWRKLHQRGARVIYPAHGRPFSATKLVAAE